MRIILIFLCLFALLSIGCTREKHKNQTNEKVIETAKAYNLQYLRHDCVYRFSEIPKCAVYAESYQFPIIMQCHWALRYCYPIGLEK